MPVEQTRPKSGRMDPGAVIASQIAALAGHWAHVTLADERPWASITFAGKRYSFRVDWTATDDSSFPSKLCQILPDHEFTVPGYFVADLLVKEQSEDYLLVEALSIVDPAKGDRNH
ncbi:MAG: hypothetical protein COZ43_09295 [Sphingomonadales bacterium CG_4_10_14_3_um_filter_58_15]|nr:hypothetical protein [Sphingomonadales bacterium]PIX65523.1 MAG: hypothetical protein COZ43_09295 [Sphingomonadales bacterium CG_4_10_14_3_um_filter_58_15]